MLVPLDGTPASEQVLRVAAPILRQAEEVHLLRVVPPAGEASAARVEEAARYLDDLARSLAARAPGSLRHHVGRGDPARCILDAARAVEPDLVAMATHGGGADGSDRAYGSVAGQVVRRSAVATLVVDPLRHRPAASPHRRVLVPFDGSSDAATCLPLVTAVARAYEADVDLVFVDRGGGAVDAAHAVVEPHRRHLERAGIRARTRVVAASRSQRIAARLVQLTEQEPADLVVVSTGGRDGVIRWTVGPVTDELLRSCRLPLLVQPRP